MKEVHLPSNNKALQDRALRERTLDDLEDTLRHHCRQLRMKCKMIIDLRSKARIEIEENLLTSKSTTPGNTDQGTNKQEDKLPEILAFYKPSTHRSISIVHG